MNVKSKRSRKAAEDEATTSGTNNRRGRPYKSHESLDLNQTMVLEAALDIVKRKGLETLTIESIASQLKVSRGPVYALFKTKKKLLVELTDYLLLKTIPTDLSADASWQEKLTHYALQSERVFFEAPGIGGLLTQTGFPDSAAGQSVVKFLGRTLLDAGVNRDAIHVYILAITAMVNGSVVWLRREDKSKKQMGSKNAPKKTTDGRRRGKTLPPYPLGERDFMTAFNILILGIEAHVNAGKRKSAR